MIRPHVYMLCGRHDGDQTLQEFVVGQDTAFDRYQELLDNYGDVEEFALLDLGPVRQVWSTDGWEP